ncbi:MAG: 16S rRNA (cytidine(1402)-2'-O)-methyltransferase [Deltaproteobacteria bacterium RBG_16_54_11]|jgi:16S rRNA (cytidine1402-2'-O)-methyltransferase|nr:MAG: 16S rRNA (cytidine(1402)-2'-O)-methyltransferase [Deltaproteobacteria bacterium RBG_16_54_11]
MGKQGGKLYLVSTPIGNLHDITLRAIKVLRTVDLIAAEDTRRARQLLARYRVKAPLTSFFEHNEPAKKEALIKRLVKGQAIALISDAGTPGVSDPGFRLIRQAIEEGIEVIPIPGPSAHVAALVVSGLPTDSFHFFGFLPPKGSKRKKRLEEIKELRGTIILYEAPHRLLRTLHDIQDCCGDRQICVARELTKTYEEVIRGKITGVLEGLQGKKIRGEITLVVAGRGRGG